MENENKDNINNMPIIDKEIFLPQYRDLIDFINSNSLMDTIEETYKAVYSSSLKDLAIARINNILMRLFNGDLGRVQTFNSYMQSPNISYPNKSTSNAPINTRLKKLRDVYIEFSFAYGMMLSEPFNIGSIAVAIQSNSPNVNMVLHRNDGTEFISTLNLSSLIKMVSQLTDTLNKKLDSGNNLIDIQLINNYIEISSKFKQSIDDFKKGKGIL